MGSTGNHRRMAMSCLIKPCRPMVARQPPFKEIQVYGFPVTAAFAIPIWASTADEDLLESVVDMQLEKLGMKPETIAGKLIDYSDR